jgi:hypothetical protein
MPWIKIGGIIAAIVVIFTTGFNAGQNDIRADMLAEIERADSEWQKQVESVEARRLAAVDMVNELLNRPPEVVTNEIIRVVESGDCKRVSDDVVRLLNGK